jgi:hypothetical protein
MKLTFLVLFFPSILFQFSLEAKGFDPLIDVAVGDRAELAINNPNNLSKTGEPSVSGGSETGSGRLADVTASTFFVSPTGAASGTGSMASPWDLKTALNHPAAVQPGDTIYLRGGTYNIPTADLGFTCRLTGTLANPIKVMSYPGEWAVIDGNVSFSAIKSTSILRINGGYTWFMNFEITNSETGTRKIAVSGSNPPERRGNAIDDVGNATKLINLVVHDAGQGIAAQNDVNGNEYYGNVVYNNGWDAPDLRHGHGNYVQNATGSKKLEDNFFFNQFGENSQVFGSSLAAARNLVWIGNTFFNGGQTWWGPNISNITVRENYTYNHTFKLGQNLETSNTTADVQYNYFMDGVFLDEFAQNITFKNNTVWRGTNDPTVYLQLQNFWAPAKFTIDNNVYYKCGMGLPNGEIRVDYRGPKQRLPIIKRFNGFFAFNRVTGSQQVIYAYTKKSWIDDFQFDRNSIYIDTAPSGLKVFVRPNRYASSRGNIIIYNWDQAATVNVDVSAVLAPGDTYELRNVQDYFGDIQTGTYSGAPIAINMVGRTMARPIGYDQVTTWYHNPLQTITFPKFGGFVLIKTTLQ